MQKNPNSSFRISIIVALCFSVPLVAAYLLYYYHDKLHLSHSNKGHLIIPLIDAKHVPVQIAKSEKFKWAQTKDHWTLLYLRVSCIDDHALSTNLNRLSHMHATMGKDALRVKTLLIMPAHCSVHKIAQHYSRQYADFSYATLAQKPLLHLQKQLAHKQGLFIMDPLQNIMMYYPLNTATVDIYHDMARLLKVSQIG